MRSINLKILSLSLLLLIVYQYTPLAVAMDKSKEEDNTSPLGIDTEYLRYELFTTALPHSQVITTTPPLIVDERPSEQENEVSDRKIIQNATYTPQNLVKGSAKDLAKLIIVIDDIGYSKRDLRVIDLPVTVAILPQSPHAEEWAYIAHEKNREIIIHQPMLAKGGRFVEENTLLPEMSYESIENLIDEGMMSVPFAIGMNNHTGSAMTASLEGMEKVFRKLNKTKFFFLDSLTTGNSQVALAASNENFQGKLFKRDVFLDNEQNEAYIEKQLDKAIDLARKNGFAIAIGHPYQATINVLEKRLTHLPEDIEIIKLSELSLEL